MILNALHEYQKKETEKVEVESAHILRRIYDGKSLDFSVEELYPELKDTLKGKVHRICSRTSPSHYNYRFMML